MGDGTVGLILDVEGIAQYTGIQRIDTKLSNGIFENLHEPEDSSVESTEYVAF